MDELNKLSKNFYKVIEGFRDALTLPTDSSLYDTFKYSSILSLISLVSHLLGFYTFLSWYGCLTCTGMLLLLLFMERSENHALSEMYRNAQTRAKQIKRRAEEASARSGLQRSTNSVNKCTKDIKGRPKSAGKVVSKRRASGNSSGNKNKRSTLLNR